MCEPAFLALGLMIKQWERTSHEADDFNNNIVEIYGLREPRSCARSLEPSKRGVTRRAARAKRVTTVTSVTRNRASRAILLYVYGKKSDVIVEKDAEFL